LAMSTEAMLAGRSADSDVDLVVVGEVSLRQLSLLLRSADRTVRREVSPTLYRPDEYAEALEDENSFVRRIHDGSRMDLIGGDV